MAKGEVRVPNDIVDDLGYGDELAAWVWLTRTRDYVTGEPQISVRKLADLTGWHKNKAHRFLLKFRRDTSGTATGQQRDTSGTDDAPPGPVIADKRDSNGTLAGQQRDSNGTHNKESKNQRIKETRTTTTFPQSPAGSEHDDDQQKMISLNMPQKGTDYLPSDSTTPDNLPPAAPAVKAEPPPAAPVTKFVLPKAISAESWAAWMAIRAKKGGKDSDYAKRLLINAIEREAPLLGWRWQQCVDEAVSRKWIGFKAEWVLNAGGKRGDPQKPKGSNVQPYDEDVNY